ncbi:hypothetical protein A4X09_0g3841 [Tilletia walkeri]|uniref:Uncharacterized protein n=1 Tax=Tilletia walkeri TaxID=117179 RepID=A0A8X7N8H8_9BASI|nr:hypothetical protein A4X09_0g3841 [Tilletia walkeri]
MQSPTPTESSGPSGRSIPLMTSPFPPSNYPLSRSEIRRSNSNSHPALLRQVHEGVPVDVEGSDDEFGGEDYARSLRSSKLAISLVDRDSYAANESRSSVDGLSYLQSDGFVVPRTPADVPTTASSRLSEELVSSSQHSSSAVSAQENDSERHRPLTKARQRDDATEDEQKDVQHANRVVYTAPALRPVNDVSRARRHSHGLSASFSGSETGSISSEGSAVIVNLQERPSTNAVQRAQVVAPHIFSTQSRPSTATSSGTPTTPTYPAPARRPATSAQLERSPQFHQASQSGFSSARGISQTRHNTPPRRLQLDTETRAAQTEVVSVREPGTPSSTVSSSPATISTPTLVAPNSFVSPLLHVLTTPLNPTYKPSATASASISASNSLVAPPVSSRKVIDTARSASVSSSSGSLYGRSNGGSGMGSVGGAGPSRSTSIDGSGGASTGTGFTSSGKSQSVDNLHNSVPNSPMSFTRRQSSGISPGRAAPPNPLDLKPTSRSFSGRALGSDSVENLHDGTIPGRFQNTRERSVSNGVDSRMEAEMVPESPGASSARSSGSRFLSVGRKWPGYLHGNSSNESASSALQTRSPVAPTPNYPRGSLSTRSDSVQDAHSGAYLGLLNTASGASRPSTAGSAPVDAANFPRPSALNGASWAGASGTRSPERSSFTTGWEKSSQRPPTVAPEMAPRILTEDDIEYEEATHWGEPNNLFGIRRRLVASIPDLGVKNSTFSRSRAKTMEIPVMPQSTLLAEKDYKKMEERLEQREKDLSVEVLAEQETATVTLVVFTEQREAKWVTKGPASPHALPMDHLPSMNDPWGVRIDAKGIVARKKLKSNIELVSTRTILRCPECTAVRQTRMDVQCQLCRGVQAVEMVYVVLVTIRMANFTPLKLPAALISGHKQPHFHYYEGDPVMRGATLQERSVDSALTAAKRVGQQHYSQYGAKLLMVKARVDRRRITSVAVLSTKSGKRRTFDLADGHDGKVVETTPGKRSDDSATGAHQGGLGARPPTDDAVSAAGSSTSEFPSARGLGRKHSMPAVLKSGSSLFSRRGSTDDSATTIATSEKSKIRKKFFG